MEQPRIKSHLEELVSVNNRILLLQGSIGSFFYDFAEWLTHTHHKTVFKLNFNGGDEAFYPSETRNTFSYRDTYQAFPEFLVQFIKQQQNIEKHDFYIFWHRHLPIDMQVEGARYLNLGEWVNYRTYAVLDGQKLVLDSWK